MKDVNNTIIRIPRYARFATIAVVAIFVNMLAGVLLMWLIYPEWGRKTKLIVTVTVLALIAYNIARMARLG